MIENIMNKYNVPITYAFINEVYKKKDTSKVNQNIFKKTCSKIKQYEYNRCCSHVTVADVTKDNWKINKM